MNTVYGLVGANLRRLRLAAGLTQQVVADHAGLSVSFVSLLESGRKKGSLESYQRLATALSAPLPELFREERRMARQGAAVPFGHLTVAENRAVWHLVRTLRRRPR